jgi:ankyrin repeat protein
MVSIRLTSYCYVHWRLRIGPSIQPVTSASSILLHC